MNDEQDDLKKNSGQDNAAAKAGAPGDDKILNLDTGEYETKKDMQDDESVMDFGSGSGGGSAGDGAGA